MIRNPLYAMTIQMIGTGTNVSAGHDCRLEKKVFVFPPIQCSPWGLYGLAIILILDNYNNTVYFKHYTNNNHTQVNNYYHYSQDFRDTYQNKSSTNRITITDNNSDSYSNNHNNNDSSKEEVAIPKT